MSLKVTFLGTGTSQGVPMIGKEYSDAFLAQPKNHRTRSSIFVQTPDANILVDTTPEMRIQTLREGIRRVDAVFITHSHADHIMGMDDCRRWCDILGGPLPVYASDETMKIIRHVFFYAFDKPPSEIPNAYFRPDPRSFEKDVIIGGITITPLPVPHGKVTTYGLLFSEGVRKIFAYIPDAKSIPPATLEKIRYVPCVALDALRRTPHPTHMNVEEALVAVSKIKPQQAYFTHMTDDHDHDVSQASLPPGVTLAWDGLKLELP